jgi:antibiotic biosynthesis monooxygenase (ABM) superfamily enzyme
MPRPSADQEELAIWLIIVKHRVANFETWKRVYDAGSASRKEYGWTGHLILRDATDPTLVRVVNRVQDLESAKRFAASPELQAALARAGVQGAPEVSFAEDADERTY